MAAVVSAESSTWPCTGVLLQLDLIRTLTGFRFKELPLHGILTISGEPLDKDAIVKKMGWASPPRPAWGDYCETHDLSS